MFDGNSGSLAGTCSFEPNLSQLIVGGAGGVGAFFGAIAQSLSGIIVSSDMSESFVSLCMRLLHGIIGMRAQCVRILIALCLRLLGFELRVMRLEAFDPVRQQLDGRQNDGFPNGASHDRLLPAAHWA